MKNKNRVSEWTAPQELSLAPLVKHIALVLAAPMGIVLLAAVIFIVP